MTKEMKNATGTNNSSAPSTPVGAKTYSFDHETTVEVVTVNGEPWFVAADVCRALGLINPTDHIVKSLDSDEHIIYKIYRAGQNRLVNLVSESGLYSLIVRSTKPNAKKFRKWVTSEVLPSIRKTGNYAIQPGGYVTEREYRRMEMLLGMERQLRELLREQRDYYVKQRDEWQGRTMDRNNMLLELIINS